MRNIARIQSFLEAIDQFGKVMEVFLNTTAFVAYVWVCHYASFSWINLLLILFTQGPIKFVLLVCLPQDSTEIIVTGLGSKHVDRVARYSSRYVCGHCREDSIFPAVPATL